MTLLSERGESNKTNANKVSYEASYEAPLTRKTRHNIGSSLTCNDFGFILVSYIFVFAEYLHNETNELFA